MREIMDNKKILLMNLSKGRIGEDNSALLGAMMITKIQISAMTRVDMPEEKRADFYLFVDEFQNFATESFANILSEARKYRLDLIMAHQYIEQLDDMVKAAVFGNVGSLICFRVGAEDAEFLALEFEPIYEQNDLVNLSKYNVYLKLMIDGVASNGFSATGLPPVSGETGNEDKVIKVTQERYSRKRKEVEEKIMRWSGVDEVHKGAASQARPEESVPVGPQRSQKQKGIKYSSYPNQRPPRQSQPGSYQPQNQGPRNYPARNPAQTQPQRSTPPASNQAPVRPQRFQPATPRPASEEVSLSQLRSRQEQRAARPANNQSPVSSSQPQRAAPRQSAPRPQSQQSNQHILHRLKTRNQKSSRPSSRPAQSPASPIEPTKPVEQVTKPKVQDSSPQRTKPATTAPKGGNQTMAQGQVVKF